MLIQMNVDVSCGVTIELFSTFKQFRILKTNNNTEHRGHKINK